MITTLSGHHSVRYALEGLRNGMGLSENPALLAPFNCLAHLHSLIRAGHTH